MPFRRFFFSFTPFIGRESTILLVLRGQLRFPFFFIFTPVVEEGIKGTCKNTGNGEAELSK